MHFFKSFAVLAAFCSHKSLAVPTDSAEGVIYRELNEFRADPSGYATRRGITVSCRDRSPHPALEIVTELETAAYFQASTLASKECTLISHATCDQYCHLFGSCSYLDRVRSFVGPDREYTDVGEVLVKGVKNPLRIVEFLLGSQGHCDHINNANRNSMGAALLHVDKTVFVLVLVEMQDLPE